jgi:hypothetical protein
LFSKQVVICCLFATSIRVKTTWFVWEQTFTNQAIFYVIIQKKVSASGADANDPSPVTSLASQCFNGGRMDSRGAAANRVVTTNNYTLIDNCIALLPSIGGESFPCLLFQGCMHHHPLLICIVALSHQIPPHQAWTPIGPCTVAKRARNRLDHRLWMEVFLHQFSSRAS